MLSLFFTKKQIVKRTSHFQYNVELMDGGMSGKESGVNHLASSISLPSGLISPLAHSAVNPTMREWGKGHGWLPKYLMFFTRIPTSSSSSRSTVSSRLSPGSTNPARTLYLPFGEWGLLARRRDCPFVTASMIAGFKIG